MTLPSSSFALFILKLLNYKTDYNGKNAALTALNSVHEVLQLNKLRDHWLSCSALTQLPVDIALSRGFCRLWCASTALGLSSPHTPLIAGVLGFLCFTPTHCWGLGLSLPHTHSLLGSWAFCAPHPLIVEVLGSRVCWKMNWIWQQISKRQTTCVASCIKRTYTDLMLVHSILDTVYIWSSVV